MKNRFRRNFNVKSIPHNNKASDESADDLETSYFYQTCRHSSAQKNIETSFTKNFEEIVESASTKVSGNFTENPTVYPLLTIYGIEEFRVKMKEVIVTNSQQPRNKPKM